MGQRVAQVELAPFARFALVASHDVGLHAHGSRNGLGEQVKVVAQRLERGALQAREEIGVGDDGRLDHFGQAGPELALGQGAQQ